MFVNHYRPIERIDWNVTYTVITGDVFRQKTYNRQQDLSTFVHRDHWQLCAYFSQAYYLVMSDLDSVYLFPEFNERAMFTSSTSTKEGEASKAKAQSRVAEYWKSLFEEVCFVGGALSKSEKKKPVEEQRVITTRCNINTKLTGHSHKKGSTQAMADRGYPALGIIFRTGWAVRGTHTLFDYVYNKEQLVQLAGMLFQ